MSRPGPRGPVNSLEVASSGTFGQEIQACCGKLASSTKKRGSKQFKQVAPQAQRVTTSRAYYQHFASEWWQTGRDLRAVS